MLNRVELIGNLGADAEVTNLENNRKVANFSLATTSSFKNKDGNWEKITDWHRISVFNPSDFVLQKALLKGNLVRIEGALKTTVVDKDNIKTYYTKVNAKSILLLNGKDTDEVTVDTVIPDGIGGTGTEDDLPF